MAFLSSHEMNYTKYELKLGVNHVDVNHRGTQDRSAANSMDVLVCDGKGPGSIYFGTRVDFLSSHEMNFQNSSHEMTKIRPIPKRIAPRAFPGLYEHIHGVCRSSDERDSNMFDLPSVFRSCSWQFRSPGWVTDMDDLSDRQVVRACRKPPHL